MYGHLEQRVGVPHTCMDISHNVLEFRNYLDDVNTVKLRY